jgi:hypothetical protein|tara:strand:- start:2849 stop:5119 length:2271 start_codon:yes stop_codon:yes gene_type:complete
MDDPVPVLAPPRRGTRNTPARVALGFNVKEDALDDRSVGDADSPTAVVDGTLVRTASGSAGFDSDDGEKTSLLSAKELTVPNHDIRIMLKNGSSKPMEVLRSHMVTSLTLSMKPEWFMKHQHVFSRSSRLLLGGSSLPEEMTQNDLYNKLDDPNEYREVVMKLADLQYIRVKAVVNVNEAGDIDEREYWLPLNKSQTVGEIKRLVASADGLESANEKLLSNVDMSTGMSMVLRGKELDNDITVESQGLEHNALVHLFVKRDANVSVAMRGNNQLEIKLNVNKTADSMRDNLNVNMSTMAGSLDSARYTRRNGSISIYPRSGLRSGPLSAYGGREGTSLELRPHLPRTSPRYGSSNPVSIVSPHSATFGANSFGGRSVIGSSWSYRSPLLNRGPLEKAKSVSPPSAPTTPFGSPGALPASFDLAREGLLMGKAPQLSQGGNGGAYFLKGVDGKPAAVFKPADEEPFAPNNPRGHRSSLNGEGMRKGTKAGEGATREVAAYLLDHGGFAGVPATSLVHLTDGNGQDDDDGKLGSLQEYVENTAEAEGYGPSMFPTDEVHRITVLDIRLANTDRNAGNILCRSDEKGKVVSLIPIDHGYALPHTLEDVCFEWEFWPQASIPYGEDVKEYVELLDADADIEYLRENDIELQASSERVLRVCTLLLKESLKRDFTAANIASMLSRKMINRKSDIEKIAAQAASTAIAEGRSERGLLVHKSPENGSFWNDLAGDEVAESRFMTQFTKLLIAYLDDYEPGATD